MVWFHVLLQLFDYVHKLMIMALARLRCVMYGRSACYCRGARELHTLQDLKGQIMNDEQSVL